MDNVNNFDKDYATIYAEELEEFKKTSNIIGR